MEQKEYLSEESYLKIKKKITIISLVILIIGILLGGLLIATGAIKQRNGKEENVENNSQVEEKLRTKEEIQADINNTQSQIDNIESEISELKTELTQIFIDDKGYSDRYYEKDNEIKTKEQEEKKLQEELYNYNKELMNLGIEEVKKDTFKSSNNVTKYAPYYAFGIFIIIASCIVSMGIYLIAKEREIRAFTIQQNMPITKEVIDKMAPTIGKAAGTITEEVNKGIKNSINKNENNSEKENK